MKPKVIAKWPISFRVRKHKHNHNPRKRLLHPNPEIRTIKILRSFLLEWSMSVRMLKPFLSE